MMGDAIFECHAMEIDEVAKALETTYRGLSKAEAERRLREFGPNKQEETST